MIRRKLARKKSVSRLDMLDVNLFKFTEVVFDQRIPFKRICRRPIGKRDQPLGFVGLRFIFDNFITNLRQHCFKRRRVVRGRHVFSMILIFLVLHVIREGYRRVFPLHAQDITQNPLRNIMVVRAAAQTFP